MQTTHKFKTIYWNDDKSSEVKFQATDKLPAKELVTSCFVCAFHEQGVIMSKPKRGWGLPGGHREDGETPEQCARREIDEEASIEVGKLELVGRWEIKKKFDSPMNAYYPETSYQLLYVAKVIKLKPFEQNFETSERAVVPLSEVMKMHHAPEEFAEILNYILDKKL